MTWAPDFWDTGDIVIEVEQRGTGHLTEASSRWGGSHECCCYLAGLSCSSWSKECCVFQLLLQGPLLPFLTAPAWPLRFLLASRQESQESMHPYHLVSVALLTGPGDGMDTPANHINGPFCFSDEGAVRAFLKAGWLVWICKFLQKGTLPFINLQVPASGLCSSLILEEPKLMVGDANIVHHSSILPWEPAKQKVELFSLNDFMRIPPVRTRGLS